MLQLDVIGELAYPNMYIVFEWEAGPVLSELFC